MIAALESCWRVIAVVEYSREISCFVLCVLNSGYALRILVYGGGIRVSYSTRLDGYGGLRYCGMGDWGSGVGRAVARR